MADPNTLLFDHLLVLKPVKFLEGELIHDVSTVPYVPGTVLYLNQRVFYHFFQIITPPYPPLGLI